MSFSCKYTPIQLPIKNVNINRITKPLRNIKTLSNKTINKANKTKIKACIYRQRINEVKMKRNKRTIKSQLFNLNTPIWNHNPPSYPDSKQKNKINPNIQKLKRKKGEKKQKHKTTPPRCFPTPIIYLKHILRWNLQKKAAKRREGIVMLRRNIPILTSVFFNDNIIIFKTCQN